MNSHESESDESYYSAEEYDTITDYYNKDNLIDDDYEYEFFIHISLDGTKWWLPRYYKPEKDFLFKKIF